jgi:hypothetical protein
MKRQAPHETQQPQLQPPQPAQAAQALQPPKLQPLQPPQPLQPLAQPRAAQPLQPLQPRWAYCWPGTLTSLSKTKKVPKLTSDISSSLRVNCGGVSCNCTSGVGPTAPVADAPVIAMDMPTTPATGTAFFRCFCFVCGIVETSTPSGKWYKSLSPTASFIIRLARTPCKVITSHTVRASLLHAHRAPPK